MLAAAGVPGRTSIWADPLHEGPVPAVSDDELLRVRADHLAALPDGRREAIGDELRQWRAAVDDEASYDELVLWFEHDLFDQLNLIQLLDRLSRRVVRTKPITLICIGSFPGHARFKGLGELAPAEIGSLVATRTPVSDAQLALATEAWSAFRAPDPRRIGELIQRATPALPFLGAAMRRHLQEFPWTTDGLSRSERRMLSLVQSEVTDIHAIFPRMHDDEDAFYVADGSFWQIALDLARAGLLSLETRSDAFEGLPQGTMALTPLGRDVLGGREDRIARCGIDRWLGGVHLIESGRVFRWGGEGIV